MDVTELIGSDVVVTNPDCDSRWEGRLVSYAEHPSVAIDTPSGTRVVLPAAWVRSAGDCPG